MTRTEKFELTVLCLVHSEDAYLLQDRVKEDWKGYTLPGGHIEIGESIVGAGVREILSFFLVRINVRENSFLQKKELCVGYAKKFH